MSRTNREGVSRTESVKPPTRREVLVSGVFNIIKGTIGTIFMGLFISIIIEWIGITFIWPDEGYKHSQKMFNTEVKYLTEDFRESLFFNSPEELSKYINTGTGLVYEYGIEKSGFGNYLVRLNKPPVKNDPWHVKIGRSVQDYLLAVVFITQNYAVRLTILLLSFPLFALFIAYAFAKGMNSRAIRTWSGGRESGTRYHLGKFMLFGLFSVPFLVYLAWPDTIHPSTVLLPAACGVSYLVFYVVTNFKKYF